MILLNSVFGIVVLLVWCSSNSLGGIYYMLLIGFISLDYFELVILTGNPNW